MAGQTILACDDNGKFLEYISKEVGHKGKGKRHLAITVLLYNRNGQVLLQKRKHKIFDNIWDFTASTHPLHKANGKDESPEEAARRCLRAEYEISPTSPSLRPPRLGEAGRGFARRARLRRVKEIGGFNYFAKVNGFCENEHCYLMVGEYNGPIKLNPDMGYEYKWLGKEEFVNDVTKNPSNYAPWVIEGMKVLKKVVI